MLDICKASMQELCKELQLSVAPFICQTGENPFYQKGVSLYLNGFKASNVTIQGDMLDACRGTLITQY